MRSTAAALLLVVSLVAGCSSGTPPSGGRVMTFERGIFKWVSADGAPNQSWSMRGTLTVTLLDGFVMVQNLSDEKIVVPSHRVLYIGDGTNPADWD